MRLFINAMHLQRYWLIYACILTASIFIATTFPLSCDESYYLAFSKHPQLSYIDAPPFVSYLTFLQAKLGLYSRLSARAWVIVLHLIATIFLMWIVYNHNTHEKDVSMRLLVTFLMAYIVPIFGLFGILILPDSGLILSLSILLWTADNVIREQDISWKNAIFLGFGLGIGLLAKYHILPLGGGMLLGLLIDLSARSRCSFSLFVKIGVSLVIGLVLALPVLIWNVDNHFASIIFQFQHGFSSNHWQLVTLASFILFSSIYLTPWFTYLLLKRGLFKKMQYSLLIPVATLFIILLVSSLRKSVLPHWISAAFWILIPYCVIYSDSKLGELKLLITLCKCTALIWILLIALLLLPGGLLNIKTFSKRFNPDSRAFMDLLFWQELGDMLQKNTKLAHTIKTSLAQKQNIGCRESKTIIGTYRWFWASQMEYYNLFPGAKILNLDPYSMSYYLWRDNWSNYANCHILLIGKGIPAIAEPLSTIMTIHNQYTLHGLGDYLSLDLEIINATLKDNTTLKKIQHTLKSHPHY